MEAITTIPQDFFEKIEFDKIIELHVSETLGPQGRKLAANPMVSTNVQWIKHRQLLAMEMLKSISAGEALPIRHYDDLSEALKMLEIEGYTMTLDELVQINILLRDLLAIHNHFQDLERAERYPVLTAEVKTVPPAPELNKAIDSIIDNDGNIRPNASPELSRIRRAKQSVQIEIDRTFRTLLQKYRSQELLTEENETYRNGRRVLSVPANNKRKVKGLVHDHSSTGQTSFIEPEEVMSLNNELFELDNEERYEIRRLLKALSGQLRPKLQELHNFVDHRAFLDLIRAQAKIASRYLGIVPQSTDQPHLEMVEAKHPLLYMKYRKEDRKVIPFTLDLHGKNKLLLLSGPNAGGKSIMLKGAALLQIMFQSGLLLPCSEQSVFGIFKTFCADIGDQQSLEDDLSTYSSHIKNMKAFIEHADADTFLVIDEFGSGTDPKLGGAVAESILKQLLKLKAWGVITTHYGNLKAFVYKQKGIVNGAMVFNLDNLTPTYKLKVGKPGSSYAFEVAEKAGLPKQILEYAKTRIKGNEFEVDKLLSDLEREKLRAKESADKLEKERRDLDKIVKNYARMQKDLEIQRKTFKLESQERKLQAESKHQKDLEKLVHELRKKEKAKEAVKIVVAQRESVKKKIEEVNELRAEVNEATIRTNILNRPLQAGDHVKMKRGGATGEIESISGSKAIVTMGLMTVTVQIKDLEAIHAPVNIQSVRSIRKNLKSSDESFKTEIDVRGYTSADVANLIQDFIDRALIHSVKSVRILHGKGNGTLRRTVLKKLREYKNIETRHPSPEFGGDGITIVEF